MGQSGSRGFSRGKAGLLLALGLVAACFCPAWALGAESGGVEGASLEAARLNNVGTALMNQQLLDAAAGKFGQAAKLDPKLAAAELNRGISLLYLQKTAEAKEALLRAAAMAPDDPHTWYSLGLLYRVTDEGEAGTQAFEHVLALKPGDADSHYFLGSFALEQHNNDKAVAEYQAALKLNPLHASAEFGLARALQRRGSADEARAALNKFQHMTETKVATPITHNYGEEGALGRVVNAPSVERTVGPMIPVKLVAEKVAGAGGPVRRRRWWVGPGCGGAACCRCRRRVGRA